MLRYYFYQYRSPLYRAPTLDAFCKLMEDVGFQVQSQLALTYELHMGEAFFDKEGPFSETWRMYDRSVGLPMPGGGVMECTDLHCLYAPCEIGKG